MGTMQTVLLAVGGIASVAGLLAGVLRIRTMVAGNAVEGVVVDNARETSAASRDGHLATLHAPVVEFPHEGAKVRFKSGHATRAGLPVGQRVPVRYLPSDPQATAEIATPMRMFGFPIVALVAGAVLVGIATWGR